MRDIIFTRVMLVLPSSFKVMQVHSGGATLLNPRNQATDRATSFLYLFCQQTPNSRDLRGPATRFGYAYVTRPNY